MRNVRVSLLIIISLLFLHGQAGCQAQTNPTYSTEHVLGEIIVKFEPEAFDEQGELIAESVRELNENNGLVSMERVFKGRPVGDLADIYVLRFPGDVDIMGLVGEYSQDPFVIYAEPNYIMHTMEQDSDAD